MSDPDEFMDFIMKRVTKKLMEDNSTGDVDPTKYSHWVEITDDRALLLNAQLETKSQECGKLNRKFEQAKHELFAIKSAMFNLLEELYPQILGGGGNVGIRDQGHKRFYVRISDE
jgi:hypothetical protein